MLGAQLSTGQTKKYPADICEPIVAKNTKYHLVLPASTSSSVNVYACKYRRVKEGRKRERSESLHFPAARDGENINHTTDTHSLL